MKAVLVAAGYGTRFLPITRVVPKELLPLGSRPALDVVVQELLDGGVTELLVITSRRKGTLDAWFDWDAELKAVFEREGAKAKLAKLEPPKLHVQFVRQQHMGGTGHALLLARSFAAGEPVVVAYPDDLFGEPNATAQLVAAHRATGASVLSAADLSGQDVSRYGVLDVEQRGGRPWVRALVEKPALGSEPSHLISLGRYLFTSELFDALEEGLKHHSGGEYFHVAAINALAAAGRVVAQVVDAPRYDTGAPLGYAQAFVEWGLADPDHGQAFEAWLRARLA